jgi:cyclic pyranopterin phosphate synthase
MLSHVDQNNNPTMVDVSRKTVSLRTAHAQAKVILPPELIDILENGEIKTKKGPVFQTAIIAGTQGAKKTSELIPFCHPLAIESCKIEITVDQEKAVVINCTVKLHHKTGVEMEALTGANIAALTIYDMCKAVSHNIRIEGVQLITKTGGKSDYRV